MQPNGNGTPLTGSLIGLNSDYLTEVVYQHGVNVYLGLLNAPLLKQRADILAAAAFEPSAHLPRPQPPQRAAVRASATKPLAGLPNPGVGGMAEIRALAGRPRIRSGF
jgi:hypothetical protein